MTQREYMLQLEKADAGCPHVLGNTLAEKKRYFKKCWGYWWCKSCLVEEFQRRRDMYDCEEELQAIMKPDRIREPRDASDRVYTCSESGCETLRSQDEGGATFKVCDRHWNEHYHGGSYYGYGKLK